MIREDGFLPRWSDHGLCVTEVRDVVEDPPGSRPDNEVDELHGVHEQEKP